VFFLGFGSTPLPIWVLLLFEGIGSMLQFFFLISSAMCSRSRSSVYVLEGKKRIDFLPVFSLAVIFLPRLNSIFVFEHVFSMDVRSNYESVPIFAPFSFLV
jgi:hypothetical protein